TGGYASEHEHDKLQVIFPEELLAVIAEDKRQGLIECLADDPRPSYQDDPNRVYGMCFGDYELKFTVQEGVLTIINAYKAEFYTKKLRKNTEFFRFLIYCFLI
ncbi:MAG: hypothetical protein IIX02_06865, partial [Clostridia bacterium]|nr:hypothetical protein [Clostridia bacterium]